MGDRIDALARRIWSDERGAGLTVARLALQPAALAWRVGVWIRNILYDKHLIRITSTRVPVFSVGSLTVGGAGKTPVAAWLAGWLLGQGRSVALLHGAYAADEPALHRRWHPQLRVFADKNRVRSAARAVQEGADVLILDDGFQHRRLHRDADIVLVPVESWSEPARLLPRGPYRELESSLRRAQVVLITRKTSTPAVAEETARRLRKHVAVGAVVAVASIRPCGWSQAGESAGPPAEAVLVAGIAQPELFAANVRESGVVVFDRLWFPDHHEYDARDAERIFRAAGRLPIITTAKDALKLEKLVARDRLWVLEQEVRIEAGAAELTASLEARLRENG